MSDGDAPTTATAAPRSFGDGRYQVLAPLGRGGMGAVWRSRDLRLGREVAIKEMGGRLSGGGEDALHRFQREARLLARLDDPHIVRLLDFQDRADPPFLVMELVAGSSLRELIRGGDRPDARRLVDAAWQILAGLAAAHAAGVLHRDIKPSNVLRSAGGTWKLVDFGIAFDAAGDDERLTSPDQVIGTVRYIAPELATGGAPSERSDLFAAGVTLFEFAAGRSPFSDARGPQLVAEMAAGRMRPLAELRPDLPAALAGWFGRLLAPDPVRRFADASQAMAALAELQGATGAVDPASVAPTALAAVATAVAGTVATAVTHRPPPPADAGTGTATRRRRFRRSFVVKLLVAIWLLASLSTLVAGWLVERSATAAQEARWRDEMTAAAAAAAQLVDSARFAHLAAAPTSADPYYPELHQALRRFAESNRNIRFIYAMAPPDPRSPPRTLRFVCDASAERDLDGNGVIDQTEKAAAPGDQYDAVGSAPRMLDGLRAPTADDAMTRDAWGLSLSGYAPVLDAQGRALGLIGVDASGEHILRLQADFRRQALWMQLATLVAFLAAAALVAARLNRPLAELHRTLRAVGQGDLAVRARVDSGDELGELAMALNRMIAAMAERDALRRSFEAYVGREIRERVLDRAGGTDGAAGALLACDLRGYASDQAVVESTAAAVLATLAAHGGHPWRVTGHGLVAGFAGANAVEAAVRAALAIAAGVPEQAGRRLGMGIALADEGGLDRAERLAQATARVGGDILLEPPAFAPVAPMFYADRLRTADGPVPEIVAIKGPVG
jgi:HAMP domain-containing protein